MNPGPAPTLVHDWISGPLFALIFWAAIVAGVVFVIKEIRREIRRSRDVLSPERLDQVREGGPFSYNCPGHDYEVEDGYWICRHCSDVVRTPLNCGGLHRYETRGQSLECTVCGHRTNLPYDRESGVA